MATETSHRSVVESIDRGEGLVLGGFVLTIVGAFLPWVDSSGTMVAFVETGLPLTGINLLSDAMPFSPLSVLLLGAIVSALAVAVDDDRAPFVEAALATLVVIVMLPYVFSPGFVFETPAYAGGRSLVQTGIGVYVTIVGAIAMMAGSHFEYRS